LEEFTKLEFIPHQLAPINDARESPDWFTYKAQDELSESVSHSNSIFFLLEILFLIQVCLVQVPKKISVREGIVDLESKVPNVVLLGNNNIFDGLQNE